MFRVGFFARVSVLQRCYNHLSSGTE